MYHFTTILSITSCYAGRGMMAGVGLDVPPGSPGVHREGPFTWVLAARGSDVVVMMDTADACGPAWFACVV